MLLGNVSYMLNLGTNYQTSLASYIRINEIQNLKCEINGIIKLDNIDKISIEHLYFKYDELSIFNDFNYLFLKNKIYCVMGRNGSGKSTLIDIITGLNYDYTGVVKYNDIDIKEINMYYLRFNSISIVEQEPILFTDSFYNNITFNNNCDINMVEKIKHQFKLDYFDLSNKIEENSINLSGGEKQKVCLIRSILKDSNILILDEPTSALDNESILILKNLLVSIKRNKIILIITHDKELAEIADEIINI